jgi:hypothetical protein
MRDAESLYLLSPGNWRVGECQSIPSGSEGNREKRQQVSASVRLQWKADGRHQTNARR